MGAIEERIDRRPRIGQIRDDVDAALTREQRLLEPPTGDEGHAARQRRQDEQGRISGFAAEQFQRFG